MMYSHSLSKAKNINSEIIIKKKKKTQNTAYHFMMWLDNNLHNKVYTVGCQRFWNCISFE